MFVKIVRCGVGGSVGAIETPVNDAARRLRAHIRAVHAKIKTLNIK